MKLIFFLFATTFLSLIVSDNSYGQRYDYIKITTVQAGMTDKDKPVVTFANNQDSSKLYSKKFTEILQAIEHMESKGFELYTINTMVNAVGGIGGVIITYAYMRRKK
jgi:hypothetical protein